MALVVRTITPEEHLAFVRARDSASFLQCPSWATVKSEWGHELIGWHEPGAPEHLVGSGLVLLRAVPRVSRFLAYLPEGPLIDWADPDLARWLDPMVIHLRAGGAFGIRMGPPVVLRRWSAATVKAAIGDGSAARLGDVPPDEVDPVGVQLTAGLSTAGWASQSGAHGFGAGQPAYVFQLPLADRTEADLLAGFNQLWRRNIKKADREGVRVTQGGAEDIAAFHALYVETAARDGFTGRPLSYFTRMWSAMRAEDPRRIRLYLGRHDDDLVAATTLVSVGAHAWYSYGASSTHKREVRGSNAVQWQMMRDARDEGAAVYDLRGITDTLDESDSHFGLIQFKLGTGGQAVQYAGEWDLPVNRLLYKAFSVYMNRRQAAR